MRRPQLDVGDFFVPHAQDVARSVRRDPALCFAVSVLLVGLSLLGHRSLTEDREAQRAKAAATARKATTHAPEMLPMEAP